MINIAAVTHSPANPYQLTSRGKRGQARDVRQLPASSTLYYLSTTTKQPSKFLRADREWNTTEHITHLPCKSSSHTVTQTHRSSSPHPCTLTPARSERHASSFSLLCGGTKPIQGGRSATTFHIICSIRWPRNCISSTSGLLRHSGPFPFLLRFFRRH